MTIRYASLFSGIGGFELGIKAASERTGIETECIFASEIDKSARTIYENNFGGEYLHGDITKINAADVPDFDILVAGFPCQSFSIAGKREAFRDPRGEMFFEIIRIAEAKKPKILLLENVKGLLSSTTYITFTDMLPLLYKEIMSDTRWEQKYTPMSNWNMLAENIKTYIAEKWLHTSESKKKQSGTYSMENSESDYEILENCLEHGAKKRLKYLVDQILQIMKRLNCYQKEQMHLSESKEDDVISSLEQLCSTDNLRTLDTLLLEKIMDMFDGAEMLPKPHSGENSVQTNMFTTSMGLNLTIAPKICTCAKEVNIALFIIKQWGSSTNLWRSVLSNLIEKKEGMFYVRTFSIILQSLSELGYNVEWEVRNTKAYLPQNRERVFVVGHLATDGRDRPKIFPIGEGDKILDAKEPTVDCLDANHYKGVAQQAKTMVLCDSGQGRKTQVRDVVAPLRANTGAGHNNLVVPDVARCLTGGGHSGGNHSDMTVIATELHGRIRRLTPVECERLMGFPDGFTAGVADTNRYRCIGNSVTVPVVAAIVEKILKVLSEEDNECTE